MQRRELLGLITGAALALPFSASAQQLYRLGVLSGRPRNASNFVAFFDELQQFGIVEGQQLGVDPRGFEAREDQFPTLAKELSASGVNAILCAGDAAIRAAQTAAHVPLLAISDDMVGAGLVRSLARPDSNVTGVSILSTELNAKRLELVIAAFSNARHVAVLSDPDITKPDHLDFLRIAARLHGVEMSVYQARTPEEIIPALEAASLASAEALNVLASPLFSFNSHKIVERTLALRLPAIYQWPEIAEEGGLLAYGPRITRMYRQLAHQLIKLIHGAKPSDLPVEQPTVFELVANVRTARAMDLTLPTTFLAHADLVIE